MLLVVCLCAQWCGSCRDYLPLFELEAKSFAGRARFASVDIEDDEDVLGTIDIDTFPTLLIARGDDVVFFGGVTPHAGTLRRLVESALEGGLGAMPDARLEPLLDRVRAALD